MAAAFAVLAVFAGVPGRASGVAPDKESQIRADPDFLAYYRRPGGGVNSTEPSPVSNKSATAVAVQRFRNLTRERFDQLVARGIPFIIEDAASGWDISAWTCGAFSAEFQSLKFRQEYSAAQGRGDESNLETFGSAPGSWWAEKRPNNFKDLPADAPKYAPFYWDIVKAWDSEPERGWFDPRHSGTASGGGGPTRTDGTSRVWEAVHRVRGLARLPPGADEANAKHMKRTLEFWLQPAESGSLAHVDSHCAATVAFTFGGKAVRKRWRLQLLPLNPGTELDAYTDGRVYQKKEWFPQWEGITRHGEAIVFYPGMLHEGMNLSPMPGGDVEAAVDEACIVGMTYQISHPLASGFFRHFHPRLRRLDEIKGCRHSFQDLAFFGVDQPLSPDEDRARGVAAERARELDRDGDGTVSMEEAADYYERSRAGLLRDVVPQEPFVQGGPPPQKKNARRRVSSKPPRWEDVLGYHDVDWDGKIDVQEAAENMRAFSLAEARVRREETMARHKQSRERKEEL